MSFEKTPLRGVTAQYGGRKAERALGVMETDGAKSELVFDIDVASIQDGITVADVHIPAGSLVLKAYVDVKEAFAIAGTTPDAEIAVGTEGSEATNGVFITEAQANSVGVYDITSSLRGTWASRLATDTLVGVAGTANGSFGTTGKARVVVEYLKV